MKRFGLIIVIIPALVMGQAKYAGELFELPGHARNLAMGGTGTALSQGGATGFYNPALIALDTLSTAVLAHREQFGGVVSADLFATILPPTRQLSLALGLLRRGVDQIPDTRGALDDRNGNGILDDDERLIPENIRYFNQREWGVLLSLAPRDWARWRWGVSMKFLGHWLAEELGLGMGLDVGLYRKLGRLFHLGLLLQDITTTQTFWSTGYRETTMPRITLGLAGRIPIKRLGWMVSGTGEATTRLDGERIERFAQLGSVSILGKAGLELAMGQTLLLRAGTSTLLPLTLGIGIRFPLFDLDYGYVDNTVAQVFEPTHQLSLTFQLDRLKKFLGF